jgi:nifR3 family TIM-barrel protein
MEYGFWKKLDRPIMALAPMLDVTDTVFRRVIASQGRPGVMFTEFVSVDGLTHEASREKMIRHYLRYEAGERPLVAQLWGSDPAKFREAAAIVRGLGFDGIDINMGCPDKKVVALGGGAALVQDGLRAQEIVRAAREGAGSLPVSVKTRIGFGEYDAGFAKAWIGALLEAEPVALSIHVRTRQEMSRVPAHWEIFEELVPLVRMTGTLVLGNGDVHSLAEAHEKAERYGLDGVMVGRGIFGKPWFFNAEKQGEVSVPDRLRVLVGHVKLFEEEFSGIKSFSNIYKHMHAYASDFAGARDLRFRLMHAHSAREVEDIVAAFLASYEENEVAH